MFESKTQTPVQEPSVREEIVLDKSEISINNEKPKPFDWEREKAVAVPVVVPKPPIEIVKG